MHRVVVYQLLLMAFAVACMAGCSNSASPDVANGTATTEAEYDLVLPDSSEAVSMVTGETVGAPARLADDPSAATSEKELASEEIADGADSDAPGGYQSVTADEPHNSPREEPVSDAATKSDGRRTDGDDPEAAIVVPKSAQPQDDAPLNNGREPSAQPIPEGQRVAVAPQNVAREPVDDGRTPNAEPGAEVPSAVTAKPTVKPAAPSRETLSDLPQSIQALDKDGDGQLGLYEWPREKLAEFKTLDANKDGFLTPAELVAGQKQPSDKESPSRDNKPAADKEAKSKEKATTTDDGSQPDDAQAPAADTPDKTETSDTETSDTETSDTETSDTETSDTETSDTESSDTAADEATSTDASSDDEKPEQGS